MGGFERAQWVQDCAATAKATAHEVAPVLIIGNTKRRAPSGWKVGSLRHAAVGGPCLRPLSK